MAQSLTVQASNPYLRGDMEPFHVILDWQGDADMAVSKAIAATYAQARAAASLKAPFPERIRGRIVKIETIPGDAGDKTTNAPKGTYNLTLLDPYAYDVLDGNGAARSVSAAEVVAFTTPLPVDSDLTLTIASVATTDQLGGQGAFTGGSTGWTLGGAGVWTYGSNAVAKGGDGTDALSHDAFAAVAGRKYDLTFTISGWSVGTLTPKLGNTAGTAVGADGTYTQTITAANTDGLLFTPTNTARLTIDTITVKYSDPRGRTVIWFVAP